MNRDVFETQIGRLRLRTVMLGLVAIPIVAMVAALAYATYRENDASIEDAYRVAEAIDASTAAQTEEFLRRAQHGLSELSRRPQVQALDAAKCDPLLADLKRLQPEFANVLTLDATGRLVCSATAVASGSSPAPDPRFYFAETARSQKFTIGKPARGFITGRWVSTLAYPIQNDHGQFIGVVAASVDLATYTPHITHRSLPPSAVVGIVNTEGTIIARSEDAQRVGSVSGADATKLMLRQKAGRVRAREYRGMDRFFAFTPIGDSNWIAWVSLDAATVLAPARRAAVKRLALALVLILAITALTVHVARRIANPIEAISRTLAAARTKHVHSRAPVSGPIETQQIAVELNSMLDERTQAEAEISGLNGELGQRVIERTAQLEQMRDLSRRLGEQAETERRNISRELHDRVGPNLVALQLNLGMMQAALPPDALDRSALSDARNVLEQTIVQVRDVMSDLRPPALDDYGLLAAIRSYAERFAARLGARVDVQGADLSPRPSSAVETGLFRIAQEALNNIAKHAHARHVLVAAQRTPKGITLAITDDGVGFDSGAQRRPGSLGLDTMRERAEALGAGLRIESRPGGPTRVVVELACEPI